jgi:hypothetical protein
LRLVRVLRAVRLLKKIAEKVTSHEQWIPPARYNQATVDEVRTIAGILRVLAETYDIIHDRKLTSCMKAFIEWNESDYNPFSLSPSALLMTTPKNNQKVKYALETFQKHLFVDEELSNLFPKKFDTILTDIIMYSDQNLAKESLRILLMYKNHEEILLNSMRNIQLLYTPKSELAYKTMLNSLKQIQRIAEAYEVWCDLKNPEEISVAITTERALLDVLQYIQVKPVQQEFDLTPTCYVNVEVQQMLTNLNMISTIMLLQTTLLDTLNSPVHHHHQHTSTLSVDPIGGPNPTPSSPIAAHHLLEGRGPTAKSPNAMRKKNLFPQSDETEIDDPTAAAAAAAATSSSQLILNILITSNKLITEYLRNNETNQVIVFQHMEWFLSKIDDNIASSKVIRQVLSRNRYLIKQSQRKYMAEIMQKIISNGRKPEYLDYFIGLTDIPDMEDSSLAYLHNEITRYITHSERSSYILLWCCSPTSEDYEDRRKIMAPYLNSHCPVDDLPSELQYHINLLTLLASCKLGPKIQAIYPLDDIVAALIDPNTIWHVRIPLTGLVLEVVNSSLEGLESSDAIWKYFNYFESSIRQLMTEFLPLLTQQQNFNKLQHQQDWISLGLCLISKFFTNFNFELFYDLISNYQNDENNLLQVTSLSEYELKILTSKLFSTLHSFHEKYSKLLSKFTKKLIHNAMMSWHGFGDGDPFAGGGGGGGSGANTSSSIFVVKDKRRSITSMRRSSVQAEVQQVLFRQQYQIFIEIIINNYHINRTSMKRESIELFERLPSIHNSNIKADIRLEPFVYKLTSYLKNSLQNTNTSRLIDPSNANTATWILSTFRKILEKNIQMTVKEISKPRYELLLVADQLNEEHQQMMEFHDVVNEYGVTHLCLELIAVGIHQNLVNEAVKLLTVLLAGHGGDGHRTVQETIFHYLSSTDSTLFFEQLRDLFEHLRSWCQREDENFDLDRVIGSTSPTTGVANGNLPVTNTAPEAIYSLSLITHMTLGNYQPNKLILREQEGNSRHVNILDHLSGLVDLLSRMNRLLLCDPCLLIRVLDVILSLIKGPSPDCQDYFILHTELLISLNRILKWSPSLYTTSPVYTHNLTLVKEYSLDIIRGCMEGVLVSMRNVIIEKVQTTIEFNLLTELLIPTAYGVYGEILHTNILNKLQTKYLVLVKALNKVTTHSINATNTNTTTNTNTIGSVPSTSLSSSFDLSSSVTEKMNRDIASIEIVWNQVLYRHYFYIPLSAQNLSITSKSKLLADIDFLTQERKLTHFLKKALELHREGVHQERLKSFYGLGHIWSLKLCLTGAMFVNICVMNFLLISHYVVEDTSEDTMEGHSTASSSVEHHDHALTSPLDLHLPSRVRDTLNSLLLLHLVLTSITLAIIFIVHVPLNLSSSSSSSSLINKDHHPFLFLLLSLPCHLSPMTLWYITHLALTWIAYKFHPVFVTVLILEYIALDQTTNEILLTVVNPWRFILTTIALLLISLYLFAVLTFVYYRNQFRDLFVTSLWDSFKIMLTYGFRTEEGIGAIMFHEIKSSRLVYDIFFYLLVGVILRNVLFGIIIDNNAELRLIKIEREQTLNNCCFICGVTQQEFEKRSHHTVNFKLIHCGETHQLWHYVFFLMKLWSQAPEEDTSVEKYLRNCLKYHDVSWFPIGMIGMDEDVNNTNGITTAGGIGGEEKGGVKRDDGAGGGGDGDDDGREKESLGGAPNRNNQSSEQFKFHEKIQKRLFDLQTHQQNQMDPDQQHQAPHGHHQSRATTPPSLSRMPSGKREAIEQIIQREIEPFQAALMEINETASQLTDKINQLPPKKVIRMRRQYSK